MSSKVATSIRLPDTTKEQIQRTKKQVERSTGLKISDGAIMRSALERGLKAMSGEFAE